MSGDFVTSIKDSLYFLCQVRRKISGTFDLAAVSNCGVCQKLVAEALILSLSIG